MKQLGWIIIENGSGQFERTDCTFNFILEFRTVHISLGVTNPFTNPVGEKGSGDRGVLDAGYLLEQHLL